MGLLGAQLVREIMSIPGVKEIYIKPKEIRMKKESGSSWEEIEKAVFKALNRAFRRKEIRVIKG